MLVVPVLVALLSFNVIAAQEDYRWRGPIARGSLIEIRGINGNVRAEPSTSSEVEVQAKVEGDESASSVQVHVVRHENGVTICTVFPGETVCRAMGDTGPGAQSEFRRTGAGRSELLRQHGQRGRRSRFVEERRAGVHRQRAGAGFDDWNPPRENGKWVDHGITAKAVLV